MDLSRIGAHYKIGDVVAIEPGTYWRKYIAKPGESYPHDGVHGTVIGYEAQRLLSGEQPEEVPLDQRSLCVIETVEGEQIVEHWAMIRRATPLMALAFATREI